MKRLLLFCCLFAASGAVTNAQTVNYQGTEINTRPTQLTKTDYTSKVGQLNTFIGQNNLEASKNQWNQIHNGIKAEFANLKTKYHAAIDAGNETEKAYIQSLLVSQQKVYLDIMNLKEDMVTNKEKLVAKLTEFGNNML